MTKRPGRDQRAPMERLVRIAATLAARGAVGEEGPRLAEVAGFEGEGAADQLARDIRALNAQGWQIDNVGEPGGVARYRMRTVDNRLRLRLTPAQQRALQRAVLLADRDDLVERLGLAGDPTRGERVDAAVPTGGHDPDLAVVLRAVRLGCLVRFGYKGTRRVVHPESVRTQNGTWYLRGCEDGDRTGTVKSFVVTRMDDVEADAPGTARAPQPARHAGLHPMAWELDPPVDVALRTTPDFEPDVRRWLGDPAAVEPHGDDVVLHYRVTNRGALRARLYELGRRVVLLGPEEVRRELLAELEERRGGGAA